jgi:hypothetical protein
MEWTKARGLFDRGLNRRKVAHNTYALLYNRNDVDPATGKSKERIEFELHNKTILTLYPDQTFTVDNHDYWRSPVTKDRFRRLLPWNGHISSWSMRQTLLFKGSSHVPIYVWVLWLSGVGARPWKNGATFNINGDREDLPTELARLNATEVVSRIEPFAREAIKALEKQQLVDCPVCEEFVKAETSRMWAPHIFEAHMNEEALEPTVQIVRYAALASHRPDHLNAVKMYKPENQILWRRQSTKKGLAEQVERRFAEGLNGILDPRGFRRVLVADVVRYLLDAFGFQAGSE